jgi:hypothetical protein
VNTSPLRRCAGLRIARGAGLVSLVLLTGCAGPTVHESLGVRSFDTNVLLGTHATPMPAPVPTHATDIPGFPAPFALPPAPPPATSSAPPPSAPTKATCPTASATSFPKQPATPDLDQPIVPGGYIYRQSGTTKAGNARAVALPPSLTRFITAVTSATDASGIRRIDWTVTDVFIDRTSVETRYEDVHGSPQSATDGIYLVSQKARDAHGGVVGQFTPATPVLIVALPVGSSTANQGWSSSGTDPTGGVTMLVQGQMLDRKRIDACGSVVGTYVVEVKSTVQRAGGSTDTVTGDLDVATGMGGLFAASQSTLTRTQLGSVVYQEGVSLILATDHPTVAVPSAVATQSGGARG